MGISIQGSRNYSAMVIRIPDLKKAENSDNLYLLEAFGITAIVDKGWLDRVGELAILFPAEVQLDFVYLTSNNLWRESEQNLDPEKKGYIEKNRRVRSIKLRGNISNGLAMPLDSLYRIADHTQLKEGDVFDTIDGHLLCEKYVIPVKEAGPTKSERQVKRAFRRVDNTFLPKHFDTAQWLREMDQVQSHEEIIITQKVHGTSVRLANTVVKRRLTWAEKLAQKLGLAVKEHDYDLVAGSRRVIKDPNNPNQDHYYGSDIWTNALEDFGRNLPKNIVVYGELVGFTQDNKPIQRGFTYECDPNGHEVGEKTQLYVYRVAIITEDADLYDMSWDQVKAFCERQGLKTVPELDRLPKGALILEDFVEKDFNHEYHRTSQKPFAEEPVKLSEGGTGKDEGICIRVERGVSPLFYKYKNKSFYEFETKQLDTGEADLESLG